MTERQYTIGDIVIVKESFCAALVPGSYMGYIYDVYQDAKDNTKQGVMILTENGEDLAGMSYEDQQQHLVYVGKSPFNMRIEAHEVLQIVCSDAAYYKPIFENLTQFADDSEVKNHIQKIIMAANQMYVDKLKQV